MNKKIYVIGLSRFTSPSGICRYAFNLTEILSGLDKVEVTLLIGKWQEEYYKKSFNWDGIKVNLEVITIRNSSLRRNFWFIFQLPFLLKSRKVSWLFLSFPIPFVSLFAKKVNVVTSIHDLYAFEFPQNFKFPIFNRLFTIISAKSAKIISALSFTTAQKIKEYLPSFSDKVVVNYTPFPYREFSEDIISDGDYILTVAQHRKNKNIDILIKAFGELKRENLSNKKLIIVGSEGPETNYLKTLIKEYSIESEVIFKHGISDDELINYYLNCSCFVLLSSTEGLGIPLIESLYYCKYVICSDIQVFREIDEENCNFINLETNPEKMLIKYFLTELKLNKKFGKMDRRFTLSEVRNNYNILLEKYKSKCLK